MPVFRYSCPACGGLARLLADITPQVAPLCPACGGATVRQRGLPSTHKKEILDNGMMSERLERFSDAEVLYKERDKKKAI